MPALLRQAPLVSICVPAFRSQDFIAATLESALAQTVDAIEIIVSNDGGHPTPALAAFRERRGVRVFEQKERLGWVANSNFVLSQATGRYFMILPHDDRLAPRYVEACLQMLESDRYCFAACSDMAMPGGVLRPKEVRGGIRQRVPHVMRHLYNGYSYRALMRREPRDFERLKLRPNPPHDFCADTTWILQQAAFGELRRVPEVLYVKTRPRGSTSVGWQRIPPPDLRLAWAEHCRQMGEIASGLLKDPALVRALVDHRRDARRVMEAPGHLKAAMVQG